MDQIQDPPRICSGQGPETTTNAPNLQTRIVLVASIMAVDSGLDRRRQLLMNFTRSLKALFHHNFVAPLHRHTGSDLHHSLSLQKSWLQICKLLQLRQSRGATDAVFELGNICRDLHVSSTMSTSACCISCGCSALWSAVTPSCLFLSSYYNHIKMEDLYVETAVSLYLNGLGDFCIQD